MAKNADKNIDLSFYQELFESSLNGIAIYDPSFKCIMVNKVGSQVLGINQKQAIGKKMEELVSGIKKTERYQKYRETLKTGKSFSLFYTKKKGKQEQDLCVKTCKIGDNLALFVSDVTEVKENAEKFQESQSGMESLLFGINSPVFFKDRQGKYTSVNKAFLEFFGLKDEDVVGRANRNLLPKAEADDLDEIDKKLFSGELETFTEESPKVDFKGDVHWFSSSVVPLKNKDEIIGLVGVAFDITHRKIAETELELLATAIHQISEAIVITGVEGDIQYVNPAFERITGYAAEEVIGKNPNILKSGKHEESFYQDLWNTVSKGESWQGHFYNKRKDGTNYEEEADISPVFGGPDQEITNFVAVKRDVTKEVTLETQLRQSQKMEAVGRLAGGVAHDFNNILTAILGYSEMILSTMDKEDPLYRKVEEIRKAGKRASSLTKQMLAFSRKQVVQHKLLNLNNVINEMLDMLKRITGENVKIDFSLDKNLDYVMSDISQVEQIIMNLVVNAKDAIPAVGGEVSIETGNVYLQDGFFDGNFEASPGAYVMILVKDNGCGIADETIKHIFEPFFSKKVDSVGTGLGLSTVYGIVKQHNGCITVESEEGKGAAFKILIPAAPEESISAQEETIPGKGFSSGSGNVLVVEDERPVLELAESILTLAGYSVLTASSGEEALELFHKLDDDLDLLLTDIVLSGITGDKLAEEVRKTAPDLKVLFMSGYAGEAVAVLDLGNPLNDFIEKPFSMEKLSSQVRELLNLSR